MVFTIGSALVDIFVHSHEFKFEQHDEQVWVCAAVGKKTELDSLKVCTGGAGTNVAVGLSRLGYEVAAVSEMGQDAFAKLVVQELEEEKVSTKYLIRERKEQTGGAVILVADDGARTVMVHRGAAAELEQRDMPVAALKNASWIHLSSIGGQEDVLHQIFSFAREDSVSVSWNPGQAELKLLAEKGLVGLGVWCQVLIVNKEEWDLLAAHQSQLIAAIPEVIITNGKHGGWWHERGGEAQAFESQPVTSVDDTGAGDAFAAGYVGARLSEKSISQAISWGVANASAVVQQVGAKPGLLSRSQLETMK